MKTARQQFAERLRTALTQAGYNARPAVLEREFNSRYWGKSVTLHGVRRWLRGETIPTDDKLLVLASWLQVDPDELRFGKRSRSMQEPVRQDYDVLSPRERKALECFHALPSMQRELVCNLILALATPPAAAGTTCNKAD